MVAFVLAVLGAVVAAFAPTGQVVGSFGSSTTSVMRPSQVSTFHYNVSMFQTDGAWVLVVVSVPVLLALGAVLVRHQAARIAAAVLLWIGCVVGIFSVGVFFVPAAIVMTVAATRRERSPVPTLPPVSAG
jgi:hypothetical protein